MAFEFFERSGPFALAELAQHVGAELPLKRDQLIGNVRSLTDAGPGDLTFLDNRKYLDIFAATKASACLIEKRYLGQCPEHVIPLVVADPYAAFATLLRLFYPDTARPGTIFSDEVSPHAIIHPSAHISENVAIDPGVVIGARAVISGGTCIAAHAVIGPNVQIGSDCSIGAGCVVQNAVLGNRIILHPGVKIGQDGFGYAPTKGHHQKIPQVGRVVIHNDVEIGANTTIDRGGLRDTVIGEGTKIDNLVQIGHNCEIGQHCVIAGQVGLSGSVKLGNRVMIGGQAGVTEHITIGDGAQVGAKSGVMNHVPAGERWFGAPATQGRQYFRQVAMMRRLSSAGPAPAKSIKEWLREIFAPGQFTGANKNQADSDKS